MLYSFTEMIIFVSCSLVFEVDLIECSLVVDLFLLSFFIIIFIQVGKPPQRKLIFSSSHNQIKREDECSFKFCSFNRLFVIVQHNIIYTYVCVCAK